MRSKKSRPLMMTMKIVTLMLISLRAVPPSLVFRASPPPSRITPAVGTDSTETPRAAERTSASTLASDCSTAAAFAAFVEWIVASTSTEAAENVSSTSDGATPGSRLAIWAWKLAILISETSPETTNVKCI